MHEKLKEDSIYAEETCEVLVENLKDEHCRATHNRKDGHCLEVEDSMKNVEKEFYFDVREENFKG